MSSLIIGVGDQEGKKKGLTAKNLMEKVRGRKKVNDRLYMLRSIVPKISKVPFNFHLISRSFLVIITFSIVFQMDRASKLGGVIDYLSELLQRKDYAPIDLYALMDVCTCLCVPFYSSSILTMVDDIVNLTSHVIFS